MSPDTGVEKLEITDANALPVQAGPVIDLTQFEELHRLDMAPLSPQAVQYIAQFGSHEQKRLYEKAGQNSDDFNSEVANWLYENGNFDGIDSHTAWRMANKVRKFALAATSDSEPLFVPVPHLNTEKTRWEQIDPKFRNMAARHLSDIAGVEFTPIIVPGIEVDSIESQSTVQIGKFTVATTAMYRCIEESENPIRLHTSYLFSVQA